MHQDKEQFTQLHIIIIAFIELVLLHCLAHGTVTHQSISLPPPRPPHTQPRYPCTVAGHLTGRLCKCDCGNSKRKNKNPFSICICNTFFEILQFYDGLQLHAYHVQCTGLNKLPLPPGLGILWISSDRDDRMGAKIKTQKNPQGFQQNPPKKPRPKINPKKFHAKFLSLKICSRLEMI